MIGGPLTPDAISARFSSLEATIVELQARRLPEPRHARFLLVVTFDGTLFAGYHKGTFTPPDWAGAYTIVNYRLTMTAASAQTTILVAVAGVDLPAKTITIPSSQTVYSGNTSIAVAPGQGFKPRIGAAGTGGADLVLTLGCQRSTAV